MKQHRLRTLPAATWPPHCVPVLLVAFVLLALTGCTALPAQEFAAFKKSATSARELGEQIVLDYSADLQRAADYGIEVPDATSPEAGDGALADAGDGGNGDDPLAFSVLDAYKVAAAEDPIAERLKAWAVFGNYVDALSGLAEGKSVKEVAPAVNGLVKSLKDFPSESLTKVLGKVTPWTGVLTTVLELAEQAHSRATFIKLVKEASPLVDFLVIELLLADAQNYYNVRLGLYSLEVDAMTDRATDLARSFLTAAPAVSAAEPPDELVAVTQEMNEVLQRLPGGTSEVIEVNGGAADNGEYTDALGAQLRTIKTNLEGIVAQIEDKHAAMLSYRKAMVSYVTALRQLQTVSADLLKAVEQNKSGSLDVNTLVNVIIQARQAYAAYKDRK